MKKLIFLFALASLTACKNLRVTDKEIKAVQSVLDFYGGVCNRSKGWATNNGDKTSYFELEMNKSKSLEDYAEILEMPASNIAYLFYKNLGDEQKNYTHVKVKINLENGQSHEYEYSTTDLKEIERAEPILSTVSEEIKSHEYDQLLKQFEDSMAHNISELQLQTYFFSSDSAYGLVKETQLEGFTFFNAKSNGMPLIKLAGIMIREKANIPISIVMSRQTRKLYSISNKF